MNSDADTAAPALMCARHPRIVAAFTCDKCGVGMCNLCGFGKPEGSRFCVTCSGVKPSTSASAPAAGVTAASVPDPSHAAPPRPASPAPPPLRPQPAHWTNLRVPPGKTCALHTSVPATDYCSNCGGYMCQVCRFDVPGMPQHHVCPTCAVNPPTAVKGGRKTRLILSYVFAVWATLGLALLLSGALASMAAGDDSRSGLILAIIGLIFAPALAGFGLSYSTQERNLPNNTAIWTSMVWNSLTLGGYLFMAHVWPHLH